MTAYRYHLRASFRVDNEIHLGDIEPMDVGHALFKLLGGKFGPIYLLDADMRLSDPPIRSFTTVGGEEKTVDESLFRVNEDGAVVRTPVVDVAMPPWQAEPTTGMHDEAHADQTMERFIRVTDELDREAKRRKRKHRGKHHKRRRIWRLRRENAPRPMLAIEAGPSEQETKDANE